MSPTDPNASTTKNNEYVQNSSIADTHEFDSALLLAPHPGAGREFEIHRHEKTTTSVMGRVVTNETMTAIGQKGSA